MLIKDIDHHYTLIERLTRQREGNQLCASMGKIINELTGANYIKLHFINNASNDLSTTGDDLGNDQNMLSCKLNQIDMEIIKNLDTDTFDCENPFIKHNNYTVMPLYSDLSVLGIIITDKDVPEKNKALLKATLRIFVNQYTLINFCMKDALTGLFNRQAFDKIMKRLIDGKSMPSRRTKDTPGDWYFAIVDIDHFKQVNDKFGHIYGDEVLLLFSQIMNQSFRDDDLLFRYGGEEFAIALRNVDDTTSVQALERLRYNVENFNFPQVGKVTVSIGFTSIKANNMLTSITDAADKALYFAKENGRNQIHHYEQLVNNGSIVPTDYASQDIELF